jgi:hypothetical protein
MNGFALVLALAAFAEHENRLTEINRLLVERATTKSETRYVDLEREFARVRLPEAVNAMGAQFQRQWKYDPSLCVLSEEAISTKRCEVTFVARPLEVSPLLADLTGAKSVRCGAFALLRAQDKLYGWAPIFLADLPFQSK